MQNEVRCEMAVVATEPRTTPGSGKTNFMVIPLAIEHTTVKRKQTVKDYSGPLSFHICSDTRMIGAGSGGGISS